MVAVSALRSEILESRDRVWTDADLSDYPSLALELVAAEEPVEVAPGLFWRGHLLDGRVVNDVRLVVSALLPSGTPLGASGLDATRFFGLFHRTMPATYFAAGAALPVDLPRVFVADRSDRAGRVGLSFPEVTLLEVLGSWPASIHVPLDEARRILAGVLSSDQVRLPALRAALASEPQRASEMFSLLAV